MNSSFISRLALVGAAFAVILSGCERPPMESEQSGYRGTGMNEVINPRLAVEHPPIPVAQPAMPQDGPRAGDVLQNVQVLGDLSVAEFTRTMTAITEWVSPEEGCDYCHVPGNQASDDIYTKVVSRRMLQMTQDLARNWDNHIGETGVTCYTCHRGQPVPANIWFADNSEAGASNYAGARNGQNAPSPAVAYASLTSDPFSPLLTSTSDDVMIRVTSTSAVTEGGATIQDTETTYGLMMHMSDSLGVNCTYCHSTAHFGGWTGSTPARTTAFHGIQMVQELNEDYLIPLGPVYPEERLGPAGDAPKANCSTCHAGANKPLGGAQMAADYPAFRTP